MGFPGGAVRFLGYKVSHLTFLHKSLKSRHSPYGGYRILHHVALARPSPPHALFQLQHMALP